MAWIRSKTRQSTSILSTRAEDCRSKPVTIASGQNLALGTVLGKKTADGKYYAYDGLAKDGTEVAAGILARPVNSSNAGDFAEDRDIVASMYYKGNFIKANLTGWDEQAAADLGAREVDEQVIF